MASRQKTSLEQAHAAAEEATDELAKLRSDREHDHGDHNPDKKVDEAKQRGVLGSITEGTKSIFHAIAGKSEEAVEKAGESVDAAQGEPEKSSREERGKEVEEKERKIKDPASNEVTEGVNEIKDTTTTNNTPEKMQWESEVREDINYEHPLATRAHHAIDAVTDMKEGARQSIANTGESTPAKLGETTESARRKLEEVKQRAAEREVEDRLRAEEERRKAEAGYNVEAEKGESARENIYGSAWNMVDAIKKKMTLPTDIVEHKRGEHEKD